MCPCLGLGILGCRRRDPLPSILAHPAFLLLTLFSLLCHVFIVLMTPHVCYWIGFPIVFSSLPFIQVFTNQSVVLEQWHQHHLARCLLEMQNLSSPPPGLLSQHLHIEKILRFFSEHIKIEEHYFTPISFQECKMDKVIPAQPTLLTALN